MYSQNARKIAPNDLPHLPGPFVGRDEDVNKVTNILLSTHSVVQMVNIVVLPAVGKSTLAIHIGYEMTSHGVAVQYLNLDETHIFKSLDESKSIIPEQHDKKPKEALAITAKPNIYLKDKLTVAITKMFTDITLSHRDTVCFNNSTGFN